LCNSSEMRCDETNRTAGCTWHSPRPFGFLSLSNFFAVSCVVFSDSYTTILPFFWLMVEYTNIPPTNTDNVTHTKDDFNIVLCYSYLEISIGII
jgi:hypothetical protein